MRFGSNAHGLLLALLAVVSFAGAKDAVAQIARLPASVTVGTGGEASFEVRWVGSPGVQFQIAGPGFFCTATVFLTGCNPATILGRLPARQDEAPSGFVNSFSETVAVPRSVITRAYQAVQRNPANANFFFVRQFVPAPGVNVGGGANVTVFLVVNIRLSGSRAAGPLAITRFEIFGREPDDPRNKFVKLNDDTLDSGEVVARIQYTGQGRLSGYWMVAQPGDTQLTEFDLLTEASIPPEQRGQQRDFRRVKRFRIYLTPRGWTELTIPYSELPRDPPGVYFLFTRIEASRDRRSDTTLSGTRAGTVVASGATAPGPLPFLQYRVEIARLDEGLDWEPRLVDGEEGRLTLRWRTFGERDAVVRVRALDLESGEMHELIAPGGLDATVLPTEWSATRYEISAIALGRDGKPLRGAEELILRRATP